MNSEAMKQTLSNGNNNFVVSILPNRRDTQYDQCSTVAVSDSVFPGAVTTLLSLSRHHFFFQYKIRSSYGISYQVDYEQLVPACFAPIIMLSLSCSFLGCHCREF